MQILPQQNTALLSHVCLSVCPSVHRRDISLFHLYNMCKTMQTIYFLKAYHLAMTMTETKIYKKKNTNTKTHRQRQIQSDSKTQCMLFFQKQGVQGFKILYWLSSCDDKDKDMVDMDMMDNWTWTWWTPTWWTPTWWTEWIFFRGVYFSGVNIFQGQIFFRGKYFSGANIFQS